MYINIPVPYAANPSMCFLFSCALDPADGRTFSGDCDSWAKVSVRVRKRPPVADIF